MLARRDHSNRMRTAGDFILVLYELVILMGTNFNGISAVDEIEFVKYNVSGKITEYNKSR